MNKKRLLLIEDEKGLVDAVKVRLEAGGYEVLCAFDGKTGLEMAQKNKPDLIILDLMLPKLDGYKVCGFLKNDKRYAKIPVVMFTARAQESDMRLGREVGADAYITKPFKPQALLDKIGKLLESGKP